MKSNWKEIILYPAISAVVFTGILVFGNWRRGTLDTVWFYVIMALAFLFSAHFQSADQNRPYSIVRG